jgi:hypothetical protein
LAVLVGAAVAQGIWVEVAMAEMGVEAA